MTIPGIELPWEAVVTGAVVCLVFWALWNNLAGADVVLLAGAIVLTTLNLTSGRFPSVSQLGAQAGNEGVLTVAVLFVVAAALTETGGMARIAERLLGRPTTVARAQWRLMLPVVGMSSILNNTPVVAMLIPVVDDWCKRTRLSASKLFMPLSYAAILGGLCTLIGTSTNLVVQALLVEARRSDASVQPMSMLTLTPIGLPLALVGVVYVLMVSRWLLPDRRAFRADIDEARRYSVEMMVQPQSRIEGQTIERAGLRHLPGVYLSAIERHGETLVAVGPDQVLRAHDRLIFVGVVESVADLQRIHGLVPATDQVSKLSGSELNRLLIEAVVSDSSPIIGRTIRDGQFRTRYDAAVIAVYRNGERLSGKIGDVTLRAGDALLLQGHPDFVRRHRNNRDFLLVAPIENTRPVRHSRGPVALAIMGGMVLVASMESVFHVSVFNAALIAAALLGITGCLSAEQARRSLDLSVLISIVAALTIGKAIEQTGLAGYLASSLMALLGRFGPWGVLAAIYAMTLIFTELVTNNAAAAMAFPVARAAAHGLGADLTPFVVVVAIAASAGFATPLGYQTHLMVYGPGGYRFADFVRMGLPLDVLCMAVTIGLTPLFYPF